MPRQFHILIIDDEPDIADVLNRAAVTIFPEANFVYISSYTEAVVYLDGLEGWGPKLVLLDLNLQGQLSGLDFLSRVREHPLGHLIPVIILTGSPKEEDRSEAFLRGATAFTPKPFTFSDWKSYVNQLRTYWFETVTIPDLYFKKTDEPE